MSGGSRPSLSAQVAALMASFAGPKLWLDPWDKATLQQDSAGTTPVTAAGDPIGRIMDKSGAGNHATQTTTPSRPLWQTTYAAFDGIDDSWATPSIDFTSTDKVTVIAGVRKLSDAGNGVVAEFGTVFNTPGSFYVIQITTTFEASAWSTAQIKRSVPISAAPTTAVLSSIFDFGQALPADELTVRINGVVTPGALTGAGVTGNFGLNALNVGRRNNASLPFNGNLYGLIIIGRLLTAPELTLCEQYMAQQSGVSLP